MKNKILTSLMALFMLCPIYAKGQTNADILTEAEAGLRTYCEAFTTSTTPVSSSCRNNCFESQVERNSRDWIMSVYSRPEDMSKTAIWWVGDSRTVGMWAYNVIKVTDNNEDDNNALIAKVGAGHSWFNNTALGKLTSCLCDNDVVVLAMGANDVSTPDIAIGNYTRAYRNLMQTYPNVKFYVLSVNPVLEDLARQNRYSIRNADIETFNGGMSYEFSSSYINTSYVNTYDNVSRILEDNNRCSDDGVHYNNRCGIEQDVYDTVMNRIRSGGV